MVSIYPFMFENDISIFSVLLNGDHWRYTGVDKGLKIKYVLYGIIFPKADRFGGHLIIQRAFILKEMYLREGQ